MRFPIDVVFLDRELNVLKLVEGLRPWRAASARRARATLELPAGEVARRGLQVGDLLEVVEHWPEGSVNGARPRLRVIEGDCSKDNWVEPERADARPIRVLLAGPDRRFLTVTAALLSDRGCVVAVGRRLSQVAELARRERSEVVLLDGAGSLTVAAREAARIEAFNPDMRVLIVGDPFEDGLAAMPVLPKWGSLEDLYEAIVDASVAQRGWSGHARN